MNRFTSRRGISLTCLLISLFLLSGCGPRMHRMMHHFDEMSRGRMGEMHHFGERMMPFGYDGAHGNHRDGHGDGEGMRAVSQVFEKSEDGILLQVIANDPEDAETIAQIQERLSVQAEQMTTMQENVDEMVGKMEERMARRGHGRDGFGRGFGNRGLPRLGEFVDQVSIEYSELDDGGQLAITSEDSEVVEMLHSWIDGGREHELRREKSSSS